MPSTKPTKPRIGAWLIGGCGSLATTTIVGAHSIAKGLAPPYGLMTDDPGFAELEFPKLEQIQFGGHEIRDTSLESEAHEIATENGSIDPSWIPRIRPRLSKTQAWIRPGVMTPPESASGPFSGCRTPYVGETPIEAVSRISNDIREFSRALGLDRVIVVNLASTEPLVERGDSCETVNDFEAMLRSGDWSLLQSGSIYAYSAFLAGAAFINFSASRSPLVRGLRSVAEMHGVPYAGSDGKTGETLLKSVLAPLFKSRSLRVLSWVGYNILGNRDGAVLSHEANKHSKIRTKSSVLPRSLSYPLQTHVGIDYVESLGDAKVAWDHVHFAGFLGHRMSLDFTWRGCDSVLAAPLVIDLVRWADLALRRSESGNMAHLASYFKDPIDAESHEFHDQYSLLLRYANVTAR